MATYSPQSGRGVEERRSRGSSQHGLGDRDLDADKAIGINLNCLVTDIPQAYGLYLNCIELAIQNRGANKIISNITKVTEGNKD